MNMDFERCFLSAPHSQGRPGRGGRKRDLRSTWRAVPQPPSHVLGDNQGGRPGTTTTTARSPAGASLAPRSGREFAPAEGDAGAGKPGAPEGAPGAGRRGRGRGDRPRGRREAEGEGRGAPRPRRARWPSGGSRFNAGMRGEWGCGRREQKLKQLRGSIPGITTLAATGFLAI